MKLTVHPKFNSSTEKPLVLLSPLDWGLGHTTRCIPVIQQLIHEGCEVILACNGQQKTLLEAEFPSLTYLELPGYGMRYAKRRWLTIGRIIGQLPRMMLRVKRENRWLKQQMKLRNIDAVISDNRFGLHVKGIPCIFITHQLAVQTGLGAWANTQAQKQNYALIKHFTEVWVPDNKQGYTISGKLSSPNQMPPVPVKYVGGISRFEKCTALRGSEEMTNLLIILSGPEPQRTIFEELLLQQLPAFKGKVTLVRALPERFSDNAVQLRAHPDLSHVTMFNHVPAAELNRLVCEADLVISRAGYTTVMDLLKTKKKSILIPTPGQAEQEYLATHLQQQHLALTVSQKQFNLMDALHTASQFNYNSFDDNMNAYKEVVAAFVHSLRKQRMHFALNR